MSPSPATEKFLLEYRKQKKSPEERYRHYWNRVTQSRSPSARTVRQAFQLLEKSPHKELREMAGRLKEQRFVVAFDDLGANRGQLYDRGTNRGKRLQDGVILVDRRYAKSALGMVSVLAHEYKHILDYQDTVARKLNIGIFADPDNADAQNRADIFAGHVLSKLGYDIGLNKRSAKTVADLRAAWGDEWNLSCDDFNYKMKLYRKYQSLSPAEKRKLALRWGRIRKPARPRASRPPKSGQGHCNAHNHKPDCRCGWGGPR